MGRLDAGVAGRPAVQALVARQPIVDAQMSVIAYELLYRGVYGTAMATDIDPPAATASVLVDAILELGLAQLVGDRPMYVNFPGSLLESDAPLAVPPGRLVIEVLESVRSTPAVLAALASYRERGYRVAIDDYVPGRSDPVLLDHADIVKLDLDGMTAEQVAECARPMLARGLTCVAEKVESRAQFVTCRDAGIQLFQGFFLHRPENFYGRRIAVDGLAAFQLLAALQGMEWNRRDVERLIASDAGLSYRLLRAVQTASFYSSHRVSTLAQAIVVLGRDAMIRILSLITLSRLRGRPVELIRNALCRARMCELLAERAGLAESGAFFMVGLLSLMPAMIGEDLGATVESLPLGPDVRAALLTRAGDCGAALDCTEAVEQAAWSRVSFRDLSLPVINAAYVEACGWMEESLAKSDSL